MSRRAASVLPMPLPQSIMHIVNEYDAWCKNKKNNFPLEESLPKKITAAIESKFIELNVPVKVECQYLNNTLSTSQYPCCHFTITPCEEKNDKKIPLPDLAVSFDIEFENTQKSKETLESEKKQKERGQKKAKLDGQRKTLQQDITTLQGKLKIVEDGLSSLTKYQKVKNSVHRDDIAEVENSEEYKTIHKLTANPAAITQLLNQNKIRSLLSVIEKNEELQGCVKETFWGNTTPLTHDELQKIKAKDITFKLDRIDLSKLKNLLEEKKGQFQDDLQRIQRYAKKYEAALKVEEDFLAIMNVEGIAQKYDPKSQEIKSVVVASVNLANRSEDDRSFKGVSESLFAILREYDTTSLKDADKNIHKINLFQVFYQALQSQSAYGPSGQQATLLINLAERLNVSIALQEIDTGPKRRTVLTKVSRQLLELLSTIQIAIEISQKSNFTLSIFHAEKLREAITSNKILDDQLKEKMRGILRGSIVIPGIDDKTKKITVAQCAELATLKVSKLRDFTIDFQNQVFNFSQDCTTVEPNPFKNINREFFANCSFDNLTVTIPKLTENLDIGRALTVDELKNLVTKFDDPNRDPYWDTIQFLFCINDNAFKLKRATLLKQFLLNDAVSKKKKLTADDVRKLYTGLHQPIQLDFSKANMSAVILPVPDWENATLNFTDLLVIASHDQITPVHILGPWVNENERHKFHQILRNYFAKKKIEEFKFNKKLTEITLDELLDFFNNAKPGDNFQIDFQSLSACSRSSKIFRGTTHEPLDLSQILQIEDFDKVRNLINFIRRTINLNFNHGVKFPDWAQKYIQQSGTKPENVKNIDEFSKLLELVESKGKGTVDTLDDLRTPAPHPRKNQSFHMDSGDNGRYEKLLELIKEFNALGSIAEHEFQSKLLRLVQSVNELATEYQTVSGGDLLPIYACEWPKDEITSQLNLLIQNAETEAKESKNKEVATVGKLLRKIFINYYRRQDDKTRASINPKNPVDDKDIQSLNDIANELHKFVNEQKRKAAQANSHSDSVSSRLSVSGESEKDARSVPEQFIQFLKEFNEDSFTDIQRYKFVKWIKNNILNAKTQYWPLESEKKTIDDLLNEVNNARKGFQLVKDPFDEHLKKLFETIKNNYFGGVDTNDILIPQKLTEQDLVEINKVLPKDALVVLQSLSRNSDRHQLRRLHHFIESSPHDFENKVRTENEYLNIAGNKPDFESDDKIKYEYVLGILAKKWVITSQNAVEKFIALCDDFVTKQNAAQPAKQGQRKRKAALKNSAPMPTLLGSNDYFSHLLTFLSQHIANCVLTSEQRKNINEKQEQWKKTLQFSDDSMVRNFNAVVAQLLKPQPGRVSVDAAIPSQLLPAVNAIQHAPQSKSAAHIEQSSRSSQQDVVQKNTIRAFFELIEKYENKRIDENGAKQLVEIRKNIEANLKGYQGQMTQDQVNALNVEITLGSDANNNNFAYIVGILLPATQSQKQQAGGNAAADAYYSDTAVVKKSQEQGLAVGGNAAAAAASYSDTAPATTGQAQKNGGSAAAAVTSSSDSATSTPPNQQQQPSYGSAAAAAAAAADSTQENTEARAKQVREAPHVENLKNRILDELTEISRYINISNQEKEIKEPYDVFKSTYLAHYSVNQLIQLSERLNKLAISLADFSKHQPDGHDFKKQYSETIKNLRQKIAYAMAWHLEHIASQQSDTTMILASASADQLVNLKESHKKDDGGISVERGKIDYMIQYVKDHTNRADLLGRSVHQKKLFTPINAIASQAQKDTKKASDQSRKRAEIKKYFDVKMKQLNELLKQMDCSFRSEEKQYNLTAIRSVIQDVHKELKKQELFWTFWSDDRKATNQVIAHCQAVLSSISNMAEYKLYAKTYGLKKETQQSIMQGEFRKLVEYWKNNDATNITDKILNAFFEKYNDQQLTFSEAEKNDYNKMLETPDGDGVVRKAIAEKLKNIINNPVNAVDNNDIIKKTLETYIKENENNINELTYFQQNSYDKFYSEKRKIQSGETQVTISEFVAQKIDGLRTLQDQIIDLSNTEIKERKALENEQNTAYTNLFQQHADALAEINQKIERDRKIADQLMSLCELLSNEVNPPAAKHDAAAAASSGELANFSDNLNQFIQQIEKTDRIILRDDQKEQVNTTLKALLPNSTYPVADRNALTIHQKIADRLLQMIDGNITPENFKEHKLQLSGYRNLHRDESGYNTFANNADNWNSLNKLKEFYTQHQDFFIKFIGYNEAIREQIQRLTDEQQKAVLTSSDAGSNHDSSSRSSGSTKTQPPTRQTVAATLPGNQTSDAAMEHDPAKKNKNQSLTLGGIFRRAIASNKTNQPSTSQPGKKNTT